MEEEFMLAHNVEYKQQKVMVARATCDCGGRSLRLFVQLYVDQKAGRNECWYFGSVHFLFP